MRFDIFAGAGCRTVLLNGSFVSVKVNAGRQVDGSRAGITNTTIMLC